MQFLRSSWILVSCLYCYCNFAQTPVTFHSLEAMWAYADENNLQIASARTNEHIAQKSVQQAYGNLLPDITANGSFTDNVQIQPTLLPASLFGGEPGTYIEEQFGRRYVYNANITAQLNVLNMQNWFNIKSAKYQSEIANLNVSKARQTLYEQIANAYYSHLLANEITEITRLNVIIADTILQSAQQKFKEGFISEMALNTAHIHRKEADTNFQIAQQNQGLSLNQLKILLHLSAQDSLVIADPLKISLQTTTHPTSFPLHPDVRLALAQMQLSQNNVQAAKAAYIPTLSAVYQWNMQVAGDEFLNFSGSNTLPQQFWGLRLTMPIFSGFDRHLQIEKSKLDYLQQEKFYESAQNQATAEDNTRWLEYQNAYQTWQQAEEILDLYRKNDAHAARQLSEGLISLDERMETFADYVANQNDYFQRLSELLIQQYRIQIRQKAF